MTRRRLHHCVDRRQACQALAATLAGATLHVHAADPRVVRIGVAKIVSHAALDAVEKGFEAGLASAGYKEGLNVTYDRQNAQGDMARAEAIARQFRSDRVQLIHAIATPTAQAAVQQVTDIPLVFSAVTDPVAARLVPPGSAPGRKTGTNVTGVSDQWPVQLQMETYARFVPRARTWGTIYNPAEVNSVAHVGAMRQAAARLGITLVEAHAASTEQVGPAAQSLVGRVQAIAITADNTSVNRFEAISAVCNRHRIALFAGDVDSVPRGAIAAYGMDYFLIGYAAGKKAALILKGARAGDIPWGLMEKFSLVINRRAAAMQGVDLTPELLAKADKVID
jgi:putative ABC transport system substrate-binding protein